MQIARLLQTQGFGSRKECRQLVEAGLVTVGGEVIDDPRQALDPAGLVYCVDGEEWPYLEKAYLVLHKPVGFECSRAPKHHPSIFNLLPPQIGERGVQPVGRLDQDTTGLLLMSDDGQFIHVWSSGKKRTPKRYRVGLKHAHTPELIADLLAGVQLIDEPDEIVAAVAVEPVDAHTIWLTITEGKYHQVKRMIAAAGNRVESLHRDRVGGFDLPAVLEPGDWAWLTERHMAALADFPDYD